MAGRHRLPNPPAWYWRRAVAAVLVVAASGAVAGAVRSGVDPVYVAPAELDEPVPPSPLPVPVPSSVPPTSSTTKPPPPPTTTTVQPPPKPPTTTARPAPPKPKPPPVKACPSSGFGGVKPHVARAGFHLAARFGIVPTTIGGVRLGAIDRNGHPSGRALDIFVTRSQGDALAAYALANRAALGVQYVIFRQRYNDGSGWERMEDRGSPTANHQTHVHVNFRATPGTGLPC